MIKDFLQHLNIKVIRNEGDNQLLCECPWCQTNHLYVNTTTGLWDCKRGCGNGNAYQLAEKLTTFDSKGIMELLDKYGLKTGDRQPEKIRKAGKPRIKTADVRTMTDEEFEAFCKVKSIDAESYKKVMGDPYRHVKKPWALLPAYNPSRPKDKACGILRAHLEGKLIKLPSGEEKKYPQILGGTHGLFGVHWLMQEKPKHIIFTESWRNCLAAVHLGYYATASSGGASCFKDEWLSLFQDKIVTIIMDCDSSGNGGPFTNKQTGKIEHKEGHAYRSARMIYPIAEQVKIIILPFEYKEDNGNDLHNFIMEDGKLT